MKKTLFLLLMLSGLTAFGQTNIRWDAIANTTTGVGQMLPMLALPGASVSFYTGCTALPCGTLATTYESVSSSTACPTSAQVVWQLPIAAGCVATADSQGNFGGWFQAGTYQYTVTVNGYVSGPYYFNVASGAGGSSPSPPDYSVQAYSPSGALTSDANITINTTTHALNAPNGISSVTPVIDARSYGAVGDGTTDNTTAINNAIAAGISSDECVFFPPGVYAHAAAITVDPPAESSSVCIEGKNRNSRFKYTGASTTAAWSLAGSGSNYTKFVLRNLQFDADGNAEYALEITDSAKSEYMNLEARNATVGGFWCRGCVSDNWTQPIVSGHQEAFTTVPEYGLIIDWDGTSASGNETVTDPIMENVSAAGIWMPYALTSHINGGTSESNAIGVECDANCEYNHFDAIDMEANSSENILLAGISNTFTGDLSNGTTQLNEDARGNLFQGGYYTTINVAASAYGNYFTGARLDNAINDSGTYTTSRNMYHYSSASFWPDIIPEDGTYSGTSTFSGTLDLSGTTNVTGPFNIDSLNLAQQLTAQAGLSGIGLVGNLAAYSENFAGSAWTLYKDGAATVPVIVGSTDTAPDGSATASEITLSLNGGTTTSDISEVIQDVTGLANPHTPYVYFWMKSNTADTYSVVIGANSAHTLQQVVSVTPSWQRFQSLVGSNAGASDQLYVGLQGGLSVPASATADILVWGAQDISQPGPYVRTQANAAPMQYGGASDGTIFVPLSGTTGSIGGSALAAGACSSGTVSIANLTTAMAAQATPATYPGDGAWWEAYASAAGTATVKVCASVAMTPTASTYNVRVIQ